MTPGIETAYTKQKNKNNNKQQTPGEGKNLISRLTTLLDLNVLFSTTTTKIPRHKRKLESMAIQRKKLSADIVPLRKTRLMADLLDKKFKTMVLEMFKELKENVEKIKKTMYE